MKHIFRDGEIIPSTFRDLIAEDIYELFSVVSREGFLLTMVGGAVRDYLLFGKLSRDIDLEIHHRFEYDEREWASRLNRLGERLRTVYGYETEFLSFSILRIHLGASSIEMAPPREEIFEEDGNHALGHSDFKVCLYSRLDRKRGWARRDFTINALGIELGVPGNDDEFIMVDPFGGVDHLKKKVLKNCGEDFFRDPVRFLRMIRFSIKFGLSVDPQLHASLGQFNLLGLTSFYFFREAFKCRFGPFVKNFYEIVKAHHIELSDELKALSFLGLNIKDGLDLKTPEEVSIFLIYRENPASAEELAAFSEYAGLKIASIHSHQSFRKILEKLSDVDREIVINMLENSTLKEFLEWDKAYLIRSFHQFVNRCEPEVMAKIGAVNSGLYKTFLRVLEIVPRQLSGKKLFEELLTEKEIPVDKRGELLIYAHLKTVGQSDS